MTPGYRLSHEGKTRNPPGCLTLGYLVERSTQAKA